MTIVTVTPNPALDLTYTVDSLRPGEVHRVASVHSRPGGKGVNVARVVRALGLHVRATGLVGGPEGESLRGSLADFGIDDAMVTAALATRRTVNVVDTTARATVERRRRRPAEVPGTGTGRPCPRGSPPAPAPAQVR